MKVVNLVPSLQLLTLPHPTTPHKQSQMLQKDEGGQLMPTLTKYYNNDPNLRNLLSSDRIINKTMLAALWKSK